MLSLRVPMLVAAGLLFMISVTLLGLVSHTLAYSDSSTARNSVATFSDGIIQNTFAYLPASLNSNNDWIIFAAGMGGTLDAPLISILLLKRTPIRWKTRSFHAFNAGVAALSLLRIGVAIAAIAYTAIAFRNSSNFDLNATPESGRKYPGRFTLEAFNCHLRDYALEGEAGRFSRLCTEGVGLAVHGV
ncbi:hypothetical protein MMC24_003183 [Lignoscripta atroalba]|nr:hypothetical protein [Lignoscripta atroalba]